MTATWTSKLPDFINNQLPFAIAETLNALATGAVEDARQAAAIDLNVKSRSLLRNFIRAPKALKASKRRFTARVVVAAPASANASLGTILTQHEDAGAKTPFLGASVATPSRDIRKAGGKRTLIRGTELRNFKPFYSDVASREVRGQKGSFFITLKKGRAVGKKMLLQRYGRGKKSVRGLWIFVPKTTLTPKLRFNRTVKASVQANVTRAFKASFSRALASARPLRGATQSTRL